ncbi:MAG: TRAP transporter substrate-binding protein DctP [Desulfatibacillaceae bacterium]|nr:TRAP transporter substrate-binding protein DctP [Desulfatibacillaceae bacterium]
MANKNMKKLVSCAFAGQSARLACLVFFALFITGLPGNASASSQAPDKVQWRMATMAADNVGWGKHIRELVLPVVDEATSGGVSIKVFWGGILGDDFRVIERMAKGTLDGAGFTAQGAIALVPEMGVLTLPFLFENYEQVDFIREKLFFRFEELFAAKDLKLLMWADQDFDQIISRTLPLNRIEQFERTKFLSWMGVVEEATLKALGAQSVAVEVPELSSAVREGVVDAAIGPAMWAIGAQLQAAIRYINPIRLRYAPSAIVINQSSFAKLSPDHQKAFYSLRDSMTERYCQAVREDNDRALKALWAYGLREVVMDPEEVQILKDRTRPVWYELADKVYSRALLEEIIRGLAKFQ